MEYNEYSERALSVIKASIGVTDGVKPITTKFLVFSKGTSNKYHSFALFQDGENYTAVNAYAKIGRDPRAFIIANGYEETIKEAYEEKIAEKIKKGYKLVE